jgi:transcriptional regulator with XRE-family HTH domain
MEQQLSIGKQIKVARQEQRLSQVEFANKCRLNIRTIQRIENDEVTPRLYTLRILSEVLGVRLKENDNGDGDGDSDGDSDQMKKIMLVFEKRKRIRFFTFGVIVVLLASTLLLLFSGIPKRIWAPFIYLFFFADLILIGLTWRCPGCNSLLGDVFNIRYCSKCGLKFYDD